MTEAYADTPIEPVIDKRRTHRQRTLREAKAILSERTSIDCVMRDVTDEGAHLVFGDGFALPSEFRVLIVMKNVTVPARVLWQRGRDVGVAFTGPEERAPSRA